MPSRPILKLKDELKTGQHPGISWGQIPLWELGENVKFSATGPKKIKGWSSPIATGTGSTPVRGISQNLGGTQQLFWGDQTTLYFWNTVSVSTPGTGFTGIEDATVIAPATQWSFAPFGSWMLATNGVDLPQVYKGASFAALDVDSQFTTAEIFIARGPHIIAMNTSVNGKEFVWCDTGDVEDWLATASNAAGSLIIREAQSDIVAGAPLGESVMAYTKEDSYRISYVGSPNTFGYKPAATGIGAVSKHSVISVGRQNFGWGREGLWVTDGVSARYIDESVRDYLNDNVNFSQISKVCGYHDEENKAVVWYYQSTSSTNDVDRGISYNYEDGTWALLSYGRTSVAERNVFDYPLSADASGEIFYDNFGNDADGSALSAWIRTKPMDGDVADLIKEIESIRVAYKGSGLTYRFGYQEEQDDAVAWGNYQEIDSGFSFSDDRLSGRYITLELYSDQVGDSWDVSRIDVYGYASGER